MEKESKTENSFIEIKKYQYIDFLRAIAILGVLAVHSHQRIANLSTITAAIYNYGQLGVQLFFISSALTLCLSASQRKESNPINFYIRRFFRIAPLYYFGIVLYFFWGCATNFYLHGEIFIPENYSLFRVIQNIFFVHGFNPSNYNHIVPGGWSIATEVAFYALFPLLFLLLEKFGLRSFIIFAIVIAVISLCIQYISIEIIQPILVEKGILEYVMTNNGFGFIYTSIINQINVFMIGIIAFKFLHKKIATFQLLIAIFLIFVSCFIQNNHSYDTGYDGFIYTIMSAIAFAILAIKLSNMFFSDNIICKLLVEIGRLSFSMYIMHFLILDVLRIVFEHSIYKVIEVGEFRVVLVFIPLVILSYYAAKLTNRYIESPGIKYGKRFGFINYIEKPGIKYGKRFIK